VPSQRNHPGQDPAKHRSRRKRAIAVTALVILAGLLVAVSCSSQPTYSCGAGRPCSCQNEFSGECYVGCNGDNCSMDCSQTGVSCGTICGNGCNATCHDTPQCSHSCGDHCTLDCYGTPVCGGICGADCQYTCHDLSTCGVRVGPGSTVTCRSVGECNVECEAACTVTCQNADNNCNITCLASNLSKKYPDGTYRCP